MVNKKIFALCVLSICLAVYGVFWFSNPYNDKDLRVCTRDTLKNKVNGITNKNEAVDYCMFSVGINVFD